MFANAIKAVELGHIREGVRKYKERAAEAEKIQVQLNILEWRTASNTAIFCSLTKPLRDQLRKTTISQLAPNQNNPFTSGGGQGSLFNQNQPACCSMFTTQPQDRNHEEEVKVIRNSIALYLYNQQQRKAGQHTGNR